MFDKKSLTHLFALLRNPLRPMNPLWYMKPTLCVPIVLQPPSHYFLIHLSEITLRNISLYYMGEAMCRALSTGQYFLWYCPAMAATHRRPISSNNCHVIKLIKSSVSKTTWLSGLGIWKGNVRALRPSALPFPSLGSITILILTLRYYSYYIFLYINIQTRTWCFKIDIQAKH